MLSFNIDLFHLVICILGYPRAFKVLIGYFFLLLNNTPCYYTMAYLSICLLKGILVAPNLGNQEQSCYKHLCTEFCVDTFFFQMIRVNTKDHFLQLQVASLTQGSQKSLANPGPKSTPVTANFHVARLLQWPKTLISPQCQPTLMTPGSWQIPKNPGFQNIPVQFLEYPSTV